MIIRDIFLEYKRYHKDTFSSATYFRKNFPGLLPALLVGCWGSTERKTGLREPDFYRFSARRAKVLAILDVYARHFCKEEL
jgi:hypothetical protein